MNITRAIAITSTKTITKTTTGEGTYPLCNAFTRSPTGGPAHNKNKAQERTTTTTTTTTTTKART